MANEADRATAAGEEQIHFRTCPLCEATCGLEIRVGGGRVLGIKGDAADVFSRGFVCPKGATLADLHEDPDRLRTALIRDRGTGEYRAVSHDEAYAEIERRLLPIIEARGSDAVGVYLGNPNVHNMAGGLYMRPLLKALRTRNIYSASTVDQMPRHVSSGLLYGGAGLIPVPDIDRSQYLLMLGANPLESNGSLCTAPDFPGRLRALRERGGKLVVVDPRRTRTAERADEHLSIRPTSDVYFLLALAQVLLAEERVDLAGLEAHVEGLDSVRELVAPFTPEQVAGITGIAAADIRRIAIELSEAESAVVYTRIGTHTVPFGTLTSWAGDVVTLLTGNLDRPGGLMWPLAAHVRATDGRPGGRGFQLGRWKSRVRGLPEVIGELPVATLADEIEQEGDGQIRAMFVIGGNPILSNPNGARLERAFESLDFMVSVDLYRNETSRLADVILPVPSPLERSQYDFGFYGLAVRNVANYSPPIFESELPQESDVLAKLALIAMGKGAEASVEVVDALLLDATSQEAVANTCSPLHGADAAALSAEQAGRRGPEAMLDVMLRAGPYGGDLSLEGLIASPHGVDLGPLQPRLPGLLRTASGKIELAPAPVVADFERLHETGWRDPGADGGGLVLIGRRHVRSNNSWMHNIERLVKGKPRCTLQMNPADALRLGLAEGDRARVRSRVGQLDVAVEICEGLRPGVVSLPHGWGHDRPGAQLSVARAHAGVNTNLLTDEAAIDVLSGNSVLNGIPVEVEATPIQP